MNLTAARTAMADLYAAIAAPAEDGPDSAGNLDADTLLGVVEQAQQVINIAGGIQAHAIAHLAAHEEVRDDEDETGWAWKRHGLGFTAEDAASLVAPRLGVSVPVAQGRVDDAVHQVRVTPRLVDAMGSGELDLFRAHIITREVMPCPDEVARAIVDRLLDHASATRGWSETAGPLGSRTRRLVARLAPDVAADAKKRAVKDRALSRRAVSAAADAWYGLVPVEQSLVMWQAVDQLAHELRAADPDLTLDQARVDAMQQLILGQADVTIHLHATHCEGADADAGSAPDAEVRPSDGGSSRADAEPGRADTGQHPAAGATGASPSTAGANAGSDGTAAPASSGLAERADRGVVASRVFAGGAVPLTGVVELGGLNRPGTTTVDLAALPACVSLRRSTPLGCHPVTGALTSGVVPKSLAPCDLSASPPGSAGEDRYRPSPALQRLIRLRDGHCRFPGCRIAARSCDLDHVVAWPAGPTAPTNLMCLCRRHHRVKQRPGWSARLDPDGIVHWTDPTGRTMDTFPVDHLDRIHHRATKLPSPVAPVAPVAPAAQAAATAPQPRGHLTRAELAAILRREPASLDSLTRLSLAELSFDRLLELANAAARPTPAAAADLDWCIPPRRHLVDITPAGDPRTNLPDLPDLPPF